MEFIRKEIQKHFHRKNLKYIYKVKYTFHMLILNTLSSIFKLVKKPHMLYEISIKTQEVINKWFKKHAYEMISLTLH